MAVSKNYIEMESDVIKLNLIQWVAGLKDPAVLKKLLEIKSESVPGDYVEEPQAAYRKKKTSSTFPLESLITIDPEIMSGTPVFTGTRVPVRSLFDWLETETLEEFLDNFPSVSKGQALGLLHFTVELITSEISQYEVTT